MIGNPIYECLISNTPSSEHRGIIKRSGTENLKEFSKESILLGNLMSKEINEISKKSQNNSQDLEEEIKMGII